MARSLLLSSGRSLASPQGFNSTRYYPVGSATGYESTEASVSSIWQSPGTFWLLYVRIVANSLDAGTSTAKVRINSANGTGAVSIGFGSTGEFEDASGSDAITAGQTAGIQIVTSGTTGSIDVSGLSLVFAPTTQSNTVCRPLHYQSTGLSKTTTFYRALSGGSPSGTTTTEAHSQSVIGTAATIRYLHCRASSNTLDTGSTVTLRKNGGAGSSTVSIAATTTGNFQDNTNSDSISIGDLVCYEIVTGGSGAQSMNLILMAIDVITTNGKFILTSTSAGGSNPSVSTFYPLSGYSLSDTTATDYRFDANRNLTASYGYAYVSANSTSANGTLILRKTGVDTTLSISLTSGTTGLFQDTSHTPVLLSTEELNWSYTRGSANSITFRVMGLTLHDDSELTVTLDVDTKVVSRPSVTIDADTRIVSQHTASVDADVIISSGVTQHTLTVDADAKIVARNTVGADADVKIVSRQSIETDTDAKVVSRLTVSVDADAVLLAQVTIPLDTDTKIVSRQSVSIDADTKVVSRLTADLDTDVVVAPGPLVLLVDTDVVIISGTVLEVDTDVLITNQYEITLDTDVDIIYQHELTLDTDTVIDTGISAPAPGDAPMGTPVYFNITQAKEAVDGHVRLIMEIDLVDPKGNRPTGAFWTNPRRLHLCSGEAFLRDSTSTTGFTFYESLVKDWGVINQSCEVGQAFGNIADVQVVLQNSRIAAQVDNKNYTFSSGTPAMSPYPSGDDVRFSELFNFYTIIGSVLRIRILFFPGASTDQLGGGAMGGPIWSDQLFSGIVQEMKFDGDDIILDIVQNQTTALTVLPGRTLSTSPVKDFRVQRAPIAYGDYHGYYNTSPLDDVNGLPVDDAILARVLTPTVVPAYPWKQDETAPWVGPGIENSKIFTYYLFNDTRGRNDPWTYQTPTSGKPFNADMILTYHPDADVFGKVVEGTFGSSVPGQTMWPTTNFSPYEQFVLNHGNLRAEAYIPCDEVYITSATSAVTDSQNIVDGNPFTYATMPVDAANSILLRVKSVPPLGNEVILNGSIRAYVLLGDSTITTGATIKFGMYRPDKVNGVSVLDPEYIGELTIDGNAGGSTWGVLTAASNLIGKGLYDQEDYNTDTIHVYNYIRSDGFAEPITRWEWKYSARVDSTHVEMADVLIKIETGTLGSAGQTLKILGAGLIVRYVPNQDQQALVRNRTVISAVTAIYGRDPTSGHVLTSSPLKNVIQNVPVVLWMLPGKTMQDRPFDLGSCSTLAITQVCDTNLVDPCSIPVHLMLKFGEGVTFTDASAPVNYSTASTAGGLNFGSSFYASAMIDDFLASGSVGLSSQLIITEEVQIRDVLAAFIAQWPLMFYRDVMTGNWLTTAYPGGAPIISNRYVHANTADIIEFHPGIFHQSGEWYGSPYRILAAKVSMTAASQIFNRFRIKYHHFAPTGLLTREQVITETPNDCIVYSPTTHRTDGKPEDLVPNLGYDPSAVCAASQSRYGVTQWLPTIEAPSIHTDACAFAILNYLIRRSAQPKLTVELTLGTEAYDLKPGYIVRISRDFNLVYPYIDYTFQGAKKTGWDELDNNDYLVLGVQKRLSKDQVFTTILAEQIMYSINGAFWTPANDALCLEALRADDITGATDGAGLATWQKLVGSDAAQSTGAWQPTYHASGVNGRPTVEFNGTSNYMTMLGTSVDAGAASNYSFFFAMNSDATTGTRPFMSWRYDLANRIYTYQNHATPNNLAVQNGGTLRDTGADPTTGWQVISIVCDSSNGLKAYRNGTQIGSTGTYAQVRLANVALGAIGYDNTSYFDGQFSQAAVTKDVTDATRQKYEGMMAHWIGVESSLPATHPYRFSPPTTG